MAAPRRSAKAQADDPDEPEPLDQGAKEEAAPKHEGASPTAMERAYMDALRRERAGYEQRGLTDRVAQVDAELKRFKQ
ncbi:hypothetical protein ACFVIY_17685 [Streptomyces sp. NPDC127166]|uniref:hypothetical protein n=1 Tax=Streptomyces sp. NPDC127166 TaxID=3345380 RepID=UPI00362AF456